jgi:hypothetical protein
MGAFAADYNAFVEPLRDGDSSCWTPGNKVATSNHPGGTAMDLNWDGPDGKTFRYGISEAQAYPGDEARNVRELLDFYEGVIFCGGKWDIRDWMHFQMGGDTFNNPRTADFIRRKIRADGYSTYRRDRDLPVQPLSRAERYALAIIVEGRRLGITPRGIKIALSVALVESNLTMYANSNVPESLAKNPDGSDKYPHEKVGSDHDSTGLFQQRQAWGPLACTMNATCSAGLFYNGGNAGQRGLTDFDYNNMANSPGVYAQRVQVSAFPDRYDQRFAEATALYDKLSTPAQQPTEGFLMALSDQEQRALFNAIMNQRASRSPLRHLNEGAVGDAPDQVWDIDGSVHVLVTALLAGLDDPDTYALLQEVASADLAKYPDRAHDKQLAGAILKKVTAERAARTQGVNLVGDVVNAPQPVNMLPALLPAAELPTPVAPPPLTDDDYVPRHAKGSSVGDMLAALRLASRFKQTPEIAQQAETLIDALEGYQP